MRSFTTLFLVALTSATAVTAGPSSPPPLEGRCVYAPAPITPITRTPARSIMSCKSLCTVKTPSVAAYSVIESQERPGTGLCYCFDGPTANAGEPSFDCPTCFTAQDGISLCGSDRGEGNVSVWLYPATAGKA
ncbi:hypothetical protein HDU67_009338 [Dinochytrium kinnereticum]|nr:hypothetical protein HDU67_009338 [Dinochytrium kinnereticum]